MQEFAKSTSRENAIGLADDHVLAQIVHYSNARNILTEIKHSWVWTNILPDTVSISAGFMHHYGATAGINVYVDDHSSALELLEKINYTDYDVSSALVNGNAFVSMPFALAEKARNPKKPYKIIDVGYGYAVSEPTFDTYNKGQRALYMVTYFKPQLDSKTVIKVSIYIRNWAIHCTEGFYRVTERVERRYNRGREEKIHMGWDASPSFSFGKIIKFSGGEPKTPPRVVYYDDLGEITDDK